MLTLLPVLSGSLHDILSEMVDKNKNAIAEELVYIDSVINEFNATFAFIDNNPLKDIILDKIDHLITDEVRMITARPGEDLNVSFLPKGKTPEYTPDGHWAKHNRQTGKPAKIFQKLLKSTYKTRDWELFTNEFKAALCGCFNFELVSGEDIREWYKDENYYRCEGTLGNSCMRYSECSDYMGIYVDHAKMLISKKDGLLTGRAIVWEIDGITILDRIYTCFDYLENCFIDYAKSQKWWIRHNNSLLSTGCEQTWLCPDDDYESENFTHFCINIGKQYEYFPYIDSFRYYDGDCKIYTYPDQNCNCALDCTNGEYSLQNVEYECNYCGAVYYGNDDEAPSEMRYSNYDDAYYCNDCCWYSDGIDSYVSMREERVQVHDRYGIHDYPATFVDEELITNENIISPLNGIVLINDTYYKTNCCDIVYNPDLQKYEIRPDSN